VIIDAVDGDVEVGHPGGLLHVLSLRVVLYPPDAPVQRPGSLDDAVSSVEIPRCNGFLGFLGAVLGRNFAIIWLPFCGFAGAKRYGKSIW